MAVTSKGAFLRELADRIEAGQAPLLDLAGDGEKTIEGLRFVADWLEGRRTIAEVGGPVDTRVPSGLAFTCSASVEEGDSLRVTIRGNSAYGLAVGWMTPKQFAWFSDVFLDNLATAYRQGRLDMRREAQTAARGVTELLGLKVELL